VNAQVTNPKKKAQPNGRQIPVSFSASPEEIKLWKMKAKEAERTLSWWIRKRLQAMDIADQQPAAGEKA
jgi:hypothetical protein